MSSSVSKSAYYHEIYTNSIEYWHEEVENLGSEFFQNNSCLDSHFQERLEFENTLSVSKFFLLERDAYKEVIKQIEFYFHTEADTIEHMAQEFSLEPDMLIDTVQAISHYCQERISYQLSR